MCTAKFYINKYSPNIAKEFHFLDYIILLYRTKNNIVSLSNIQLLRKKNKNSGSNDSIYTYCLNCLQNSITIVHEWLVVNLVGLNTFERYS